MLDRLRDFDWSSLKGKLRHFRMAPRPTQIFTRSPTAWLSWTSGLMVRWWRGLTAVIVFMLAIYYPLGAVWVHRIDDDLRFMASDAEYPRGGSLMVATASALIKREVEDHTWTANLPFFLPGAILDNTPNYQMGMISALARISLDLNDQIGRVRGSSQVDTDLQDAAGKLQYSGEIWIFDPKTSWFIPTASANKQYLSARKALRSYNERVARGQGVFERRADNLLATLDRIGKDLGGSSASLDNQVNEGKRRFVDWRADDVFYFTKGKLYAYYLVLRDLGADFKPVIDGKDASNAWSQMLDSLREAIILQPIVVTNGKPDGAILPSHLAAQGFYLLRVRTQIQEVANILIK